MNDLYPFISVLASYKGSSTRKTDFSSSVNMSDWNLFFYSIHLNIDKITEFFLLILIGIAQDLKMHRRRCIINNDQGLSCPSKFILRRTGYSLIIPIFFDPPYWKKTLSLSYNLLLFYVLILFKTIWGKRSINVRYGPYSPPFFHRHVHSTRC